MKSRENTWRLLAEAAHFSQPFNLTPELIFTVMGAMGLAGYRSSELYLDTARQVHISEGRPWTQQLQLAARQARRACQRGRGPAKQAQALPLLKMAQLPMSSEESARGGPAHPVRSTILASCGYFERLKRQTRKSLISRWMPPASWFTGGCRAAKQTGVLGVVRTRMCICDSEAQHVLHCPFHLMQQQLQ